MYKAYRLLLALCATVATLSSCSRANYAFNPAAPAYLGSQPARTTAVLPAAPASTSPVASVVATPVATAPVKAVAVATRPAASVASTMAPAAPEQPTATTLAVEPVKVGKPTFAQRILLNKVAKQLAKADARHQNAAAVTHTAAKGAPITVAIIGLIALLVGIIASSGLLITLGSIVLVVGLVLLLLSAL